MIPSTTAFLEQDFEITEQPTHTYKMNLESNLIRGYTDGQEAMKQAIYKILNTERYANLGSYGSGIKSWFSVAKACSSTVRGASYFDFRMVYPPRAKFG